MLLRSKKFIFLSLSLAMIAFLPPLVSTKLGNSLISKILTDITSSPCYLKGQFSYFKPQKIDELKFLFQDLELKVHDVTIDQIKDMIFRKKNALISISSIYLSQKKTASTITPIAADLSAKVPIKPWGIYATITINDGTYFDNNQTPKITHIKGHLFYSCCHPIDMKIEALCPQEGFIKLQGQYDSLSKNIDGDITLKNCPSSLIPSSFITPVLGDNFNLYLNFNGSWEHGHALYSLESEKIALSGQCDLDKNHLIIKQTNEFILKSPLAYTYKGLTMQDLQGHIVVNSLDLTLASLPQIKSIFCTYEGSTQAITYQNQSSGPFHITGDLSQDHDEVIAQATLTQNNTPVLTGSALYSICEANLKKGVIKATNLPVIFPLKWDNFSVGDFLNAEANFSTKEGSFTGSLTAFSPHIKNLNSVFSYDKTQLSLKTVSLNYDDGINKLKLEGSELQTPFHDITKTTGTLDAELISYSSIQEHYLPLKSHIQCQGLDHITSLIQTPYLSLQGVGALRLGYHDFILKDTWQGQINFDTSILNLPFAQKPIVGTIHIPSGSTLNLLPIEVSLDPFYLNAQKQILVKDSVAHIDLNALSLDMALSAKATFSQEQGPQGGCEASCHIVNKTVQTAHIRLKNPPLEALSGLNQDMAKAAQFFGKNLVLDFKLIEQGQNIALEASSENLKLQGAFGFKDHLFLLKPIQGALHIKTLELPFLSSKYPFKLKKPFDLNFHIEALDIPLSVFLIQDMAISGNVNILNLSLEQNQKLLQMEAFTASFAKAKGLLPLNVKMDADVFSSYDKVLTSGSLHGSCSVGGLEGYLHKIDTKSTNLNAYFKLDNFPTLTFDFLQTKAPLPFSSTFGETINANFEMEHKAQQGHFKLLVNSKDTLVKVNAKNTHGFYTLSDDVIIQTRLSSELSSFLFANKPLGIQKLSSQYPLVCRISAKDSQFTLFPFRIEMLNLSSCIFDFGKVTLDSDKILPQTLNLLKSSSRGDNLSVWFQPIKTSIKNGLMSMARFDFFVQNAFQMALWGDVDFNQKQVGLTLGLTASCLQKAFGITELPQSYIMQIPIYGSFEDVKIDSKKATAKIAKLLALQHGGSLLEQFGGKSGGAIGGMLKELSKIPDGDKKAPEPQTPFPWEQINPKTSSKNSENPETKKAIRSSDSPIKQLLKVFF